MAKRRKKKRSKRGSETFEERCSRAFEVFLGGLAAVVRFVLVSVGRGVRAFVGWFARGSRGTQALTVCVAALLVAGYLHYRSARVERISPPVFESDEVVALARVIRSEVGHSPRVHRIHVAWATRNLAAERGQTITEMACSPCGRQERGRPVSSRMKARAIDRLLAKHVLDQPDDLDPTGGATHFINPVVQDKLAKSGRVPGYKGRTYKSVRKRWQQRYGWEPYYRLGPDLEMWGNKRGTKRTKRRRGH